MWAEVMRARWQHTSMIAAYIAEANRGKSGRRVSPDSINPMEQGNTHGGGQSGIKLNSVEGFAALRGIADRWQGGTK